MTKVIKGHNEMLSKGMSDEGSDESQLEISSLNQRGEILCQWLEERGLMIGETLAKWKRLDKCPWGLMDMLDIVSVLKEDASKVSKMLQ